MKIFFPGSFNPFTKGHADILERLVRIFDFVVIGIGVNSDKPTSKEDSEQNKAAIEKYLEQYNLDGKAEVIIYNGLSAEMALKVSAGCMARGVRTCSDYEYETNLALANKAAFGIETLLIPADPNLTFISSSIVRDLVKNGRKDIAANFLP